MTMEKVISILRTSAKSYQKNLENKNFLIIFRELEKIEYIQVKFSAENFLHLTGIQLKYQKSKKLFYRACLNGKISKEEIKLRKDGTTQLKLSVLEMMTNICKTAKMIGRYNQWGNKLNTDIMIGTNHITMGFIKLRGGFYIPNTALNENVKNVTSQTYRIIAIFGKKVNEKQYHEICFLRDGNIQNKNILAMLDSQVRNKLYN